jgi:AraC-like DNA-binding protein
MDFDQKNMELRFMTKKNNTVRIHSYTKSGKYDAVRLFKIQPWRFRKTENVPLYPFVVEETIRLSRFSFSEKFCRLLIVVLVLEGKLTYRSGERTFVVEPGKLLLIPPGSDYEFHHKSNDPSYHKLVLELKGALLNSISSTLGFQEISLLNLPKNNTIEAEIREIGELLNTGDRQNIAALLGLSLSLLYELSEWRRDSVTQPGVLAVAQAILESNLEESFRMSELSARLRVSGTTLNRLFREKLQISPARYRQNCKLEFACELLVRTNLSVKEIATQTGFCNQFYFSMEFRKFTGQSPLAYRKAANASSIPFLL